MHSRRLQTSFLWAVVALTGRLPAQTDTPAPHVAHEASFDSERQQANALFTAGRVLDSLPLYEDLCRQDSTIAVFAERRGAGLLAKSLTEPNQTQQRAVHLQGIAELRRAQKLGDNSPYVQNVLDAEDSKSPIGVVLRGIPLTVGYTYQGTPEAQALLHEAENDFAHQEIDKAAELYKQASAKDPKFYSAPLFAGDMYFRLKDTTNAGVWFAKAVAIDPDRETAYRYWGDALFKSGDREGAKSKYEQAVIAEPYGKAAWSMLRQWAQATHTALITPVIERPQFKTENGKLVPDPVLAASIVDGRAAWLTYQRVRVQHGGFTLVQVIVAGATMADGTFRPSGYRHSLEEELDALNQMLVDVRSRLKQGSVTQTTLDPALSKLLALQDAGLLAPWVLLNAYDAGTMKDYAAYRDAHRDLLIRYLDTFVTPTPRPAN